MKGVTHLTVLPYVLKMEYGFQLGHMGENRKVYRHTVTLLCRHARARVYAYALHCRYGHAHTQVHAHWPLRLGPPGVETKTLQKGTQITAHRQEEKWKGGQEG